jgi:carbonic anhydrase
MAEELWGADTVFNGAQFHFHAGSEHTIDGKRYDLEMHTVHYPRETKNDFIAAAMGLMFSVNDYTADLTPGERMVIDTFFDTLRWDITTSNPTVDLVAYGNMMNLANFNERWTYKGSVTTPPCATNVYWNVVSTVYPIR